MLFGVVFFFKQKTAYEMRISDWSSDVCSSDLSGDFHLASNLGVGGRTTATSDRSRQGRGARRAWRGRRRGEAPTKREASKARRMGDAGQAGGGSEPVAAPSRSAPLGVADIAKPLADFRQDRAIGRPSCRERECKDGE